MIASKVFTIFRGDEKTLSLKALYDETLDPLDLTNCTEISIKLQNADGTFVDLLLTDTDVAITAPAVLGKFTALITSEVSALLQPGVEMTFDVTFTIGSEVMTVAYVGAISVFERS